MAPINLMGSGSTRASIVSSGRTGYTAPSAWCRLHTADLPQRHVSSKGGTDTAPFVATEVQFVAFGL